MLEIQLLGSFEVVAGGTPATISGSKRHALLAVLALRRGRVVSVDALVDALWGEALPAAPRNAVQHHVARLRAALGHETIAAVPDGYSLPDAAVDALQFEELLREARATLRAGDARAAADLIAAALTLWRGAALHGLTETAWFEAEARRLEALRVDALEEQFEAALAVGEHREIVSALRATLEENPFRERLWGQLMLALYRSGRQADALETFQEARRVLDDELALEPGPDLRRLQEAILGHDPAIAPVAAAPKRRGNLPAPSTSFVGREEQLAQTVALLREHRLVTLTGPPGVGKSRLAVEAARALAEQAPDGAYLVDLTRAGDEADVVSLLARVLEVRGGETLEQVVARLRDSRTILVLDGCGRLVGAAAHVADALVSECPNVSVLATSREVLHVTGERRISLLPLGVAEPAADSAAVQLFAERARAARPSFELTPANARLVAEICRSVDGLPLAIELLAARANALGLAELRAIVERRLTLLDGRQGTDAARSALSTLVEWSYDLLHRDEKTLLHDVALHRGGASLRSLAAVAATQGLDEPTATYLIGALVDKSIVFVSFPADEARYDVLDTVREYACEQLRQSGELDATRRAYADHFASVLEAARPELRGPEWQSGIERLQLDNDNFWAAVELARDAGDALLAAQLGAAAGWYFVLSGRISEGRAFLELARAASSDDSPPEPRFELAAFLSYMLMEELELEAAIATAERALASVAAGEAGDQVGLLTAVLAHALAEFGDEERARATAEEALAALDGVDRWAASAANLVAAQVAAIVGDVDAAAERAVTAARHADAIGFDAFAVAVALVEAWVGEQRDNLDGAEAAYCQAVELARRAGFADHAAFAVGGLGSAALARGDLDRAEELHRQAVDAADAADATWTAAHARVDLGRVLAARGDGEGAERLYRHVLDWAERPRRHGVRESLFIALAGDPADAARAALTELVESVTSR